jgi:hypothetical protein
MTSHSAANERIKRRYFTYLAEALGHNQQTIDAAAKAIARFEAYTKWRDFKKFHIEQAKGFKQSLSDQRGSQSGEPLSKATLYATLTALWLAGQPSYKSRISYSDAEYFNLRPRRRASPKPVVRHASPPWSKFATSSDSCRPPPISKGGTAR